MAQWTLNTFVCRGNWLLLSSSLLLLLYFITYTLHISTWMFGQLHFFTNSSVITNYCINRLKMTLSEAWMWKDRQKKQKDKHEDYFLLFGRKHTVKDCLKARTHEYHWILSAFVALPGLHCSQPQMMLLGLYCAFSFLCSEKKILSFTFQVKREQTAC